MEILDFTNPETKQKAKEIKAGKESIRESISDLVITITRGHEKTQKQLESPKKYRAFIESITAEDLRAENITEESIEAFLEAPLKDKVYCIDNLDIFTVYRLYEKKEAAGNLRLPLNDLTEGYKGLENLKRQILKELLQTPETVTTLHKGGIT